MFAVDLNLCSLYICNTNLF